MNNMENKVLGIVNLAQYAGVAVQTYDVFQWIQLGLAIACSLVLLAYRIWDWYKKAKADGKIDKEEIKEGIDIIVDGVEDIKDKVEKKD